MKFMFTAFIVLSISSLIAAQRPCEGQRENIIILLKKHKLKEVFDFGEDCLIKYFDSNKIKMGWKDDKNNGLLYFSVKFNYSKLGRILIRRGLKDSPNDFGNTALESALRMKKYTFSSLILHRGAYNNHNDKLVKKRLLSLLRNRSKNSEKSVIQINENLETYILTYGLNGGSFNEIINFYPFHLKAEEFVYYLLKINNKFPELRPTTRELLLRWRELFNRHYGSYSKNFYTYMFELCDLLQIFPEIAVDVYLMHRRKNITKFSPTFHIPEKLEKTATPIFLKWSAEELANAITIRDSYLMSRMTGLGFLGGDNLGQVEIQAYEFLIKNLDYTMNILADEAKKIRTPEEGKSVYCFLVETMYYLFKHENYYGLYGIYSVISLNKDINVHASDPELVKDKNYFEFIEKILDSSKNFLNYRDIQKQLLVEGINFIPFYPLLKKDLTFTGEAGDKNNLSVHQLHLQYKALLPFIKNKDYYLKFRKGRKINGHILRFILPSIPN